MSVELRNVPNGAPEPRKPRKRKAGTKRRAKAAANSPSETQTTTSETQSTELAPEVPQDITVEIPVRNLIYIVAHSHLIRYFRHQSDYQARTLASITSSSVTNTHLPLAPHRASDAIL